MKVTAVFKDGSRKEWDMPDAANASEAIATARDFLSEDEAKKVNVWETEEDFV